jgi:2-oxo-3-hexenedioate decarboxylase
MSTQLARLLWDARALGHTINASDIDAPKTSAEAYEVQEAIISLSGLARVGYKVGSTSQEAQRHLGTTEPGAGALLQPYVYSSPAEIPIMAEHMPAVEGEFAFRLARDLPPRERAYELDEVVAAIGELSGAIEVVGTRFFGGLSGKGRFLTTADGGVNIALVTGHWIPFRGQDLREHQVRMTINGVGKGSGTGSRALGNPPNVLHWLANHLSARRLGLWRGDIVSTGTCTGLDAVRAGDRVRAEFGTLGAVETQLRPRNGKYAR